MPRWLYGCFNWMIRDQRGAIAPLMALMIIPIAGATAMATEMGEWYYFQRLLQNAADSAAIAAATNNSNTGSTYLNEARGAARGFGFVDGENNATVTAAVVTCPSGAAADATCYQATLSKVVPIALSALVGFRGDQNNGYAQTITSTAVAASAGGGAGGMYPCISVNSTADNAFEAKGAPKADLSGCTVLSNGGLSCNGGNADLNGKNSEAKVYAIGVKNKTNLCGTDQIEIPAALDDPYKSLASNIPNNTCSTYKAVTVTTIPTGNTTYCGDVTLGGNVTLTGQNTITIFNGTLNVPAGKTLSTGAGASATVIFSGTNATSSVRAPGASGTLDFTAPSSGPWAGVAIYQDPRMTGLPSTSLNVTYKGNEPTWNVSGLAYLPLSDVLWAGAVNKSSTGQNCFMLVSKTFHVNGEFNYNTSTSDCQKLGLGSIDDGSGSGGITVKLIR